MSVALLIAILAGAILWSFPRGRALERRQWLVAQLCAAFLCEFAALYWSMHAWKNHWIYNVYFCLEFTLLVGLARGQGSRLVVVLAGLAYLAVQMIEAWSGAGYRQFCNHVYMAGAFVLTALYLQRGYALAAKSDVPIQSVPMTWVYLSIVVWFGASIPFNGLLNYLVVHDLALAERLYPINEVLALVRYGLVVVGALVVLKQPARLT